MVVAGAKAIDVDGWINDAGRAAIELPYAISDGLRVGQEIVWKPGRLEVPLLQVLNYLGKKQSHKLSVFFACRVAVELPRPAHGGVAIAIWVVAAGSEEAFGIAGGTGNDQIVAGEIERFHTERIEREIDAIALLFEG